MSIKKLLSKFKWINPNHTNLGRIECLLSKFKRINRKHIWLTNKLSNVFSICSSTNINQQERNKNVENKHGSPIKLGGCCDLPFSWTSAFFWSFQNSSQRKWFSKEGGMFIYFQLLGLQPQLFSHYAFGNNMMADCRIAGHEPSPYST